MKLEIEGIMGFNDYTYICTNCGVRTLKGDEKFCPKCGYKFKPLETVRF